MPRHVLVTAAVRRADTVRKEWPPLIPEDQEKPDWHDAAQAAIRLFCGWHVAPVLMETVRVDTDGSRVVHLPTMRLVSLVSVTVGGRAVDVDTVDWSESGLIRLPYKPPSRFGAVVVTMEHGFDDTTHIAALVRNISERAEATPAGVTRKQIGDVSLSYGDAQNGGLRLFAGEKDQLAPYRLWGTP